MSVLLTKIPKVFILIGVFIYPIFVILSDQKINLLSNPILYILLNGIGIITTLFWFIAVLNYFSIKSGIKRYNNLIFGLLSITIVDWILNILDIHFLVLNIIAILAYLIMIIPLTYLIKKVFFERSIWFIYLEMFFFCDWNHDPKRYC